MYIACVFPEAHVPEAQSVVECSGVIHNDEQPAGRIIHAQLVTQEAVKEIMYWL